MIYILSFFLYEKKKKLARKFGKWGFFTKIFGRKKEEPKKVEPKKEERKTVPPSQTPVVKYAFYRSSWIDKSTKWR